MADPEPCTPEEREQLLESQASDPRPTTWEAPEPFIHFHSMSVNYSESKSSSFSGGTLRLIETDTGTRNDYESISLDLMWTARATTGAHSHTISIDDLLSIRLHATASPPEAVIQKRGGALWGILRFPSGLETQRQFRNALEKHADFSHIPDPFRDGNLLSIDATSRMRRAARPFTDSDSPLPSPRATEDKVLISVLEQFSRVTQVSREAADGVAAVLTGRHRREERERRLQAAENRRRAADLDRPVVPSTRDESALPPRLSLKRARGIPVTAAVWASHLDANGRLRDPMMMQHAVFAGGVEPTLRATVWPILLAVLPWDSTQAEREERTSEKQREYAVLRANWQAVRAAAHAARDENGAGREASGIPLALREYLQSEEQIEKDVTRTDRIVALYADEEATASRVLGELLNVYADYDRKIRYCQGMSDFMSQIVTHLAPHGGEEAEALAFWCFEALMRRVECNFRIDQSGMHAQLARLRRLVRTMDSHLAAFFDATDPDFYTCFRWIIVRFKRELPYDDTARMWEVLWSRHVAGDALHIYVAAALLRAHSSRLLALRSGEFDGLLRYINDMSGRIDADFALREGELLYKRIGAVA